MTPSDPSPAVGPDTPTPGDLRVAVRRWRRRHRTMAAAALAIVTLVWIAVVWALAGGPDATPSVRSWLTVATSAAALTAILGLAIGHLGTARLGWPGHFARLLRLATQVWQRADQRGAPSAAGLSVGLVAGLFLHPSVAIGAAAVLVGMSTTPVGEALAAWWRAGALGRAEASLGREPMSTAARRLLALAAGLAAALVAVVRWAAMEPSCGLGFVLGGACGLPPLGVAVIAVAAGLATVPIFVTLGALVSYTLDDEPLAPRLPASAPSSPAASPAPPEEGEGDQPPPGPLFGAPEVPGAELPATADEPQVDRRDRTADAPEGPPTPEPPTEEPPAPEPLPEEPPAHEPPTEGPPTPEPLTEDDPTLEVELVELAAEAALFEETREARPPAPHAAAPDVEEADVETVEDVVAAELAELSDEGRDTLTMLVRSVDPREDVDGDLGERLAALPPGALSDALGRIRLSLPTLEALRAQYGRAPSLARSAIERTCVGGLRAAGIPEDDATALAHGLLNLGRDDWQLLRDTLDRLDDHLAGGGRLSR